MREYDIIVNDDNFKLDLNKVNNIIDVILKELNLPEDCEFSVSFENKASIHELNKTYRNIDRATDILTFCQTDGMEFINSFNLILGDMVICLEELVENCIYFKENKNRELLRLLVHGFLHLTGKDHSSNDVNNEPMLIEQELLIKKLEKKIEPERRSDIFI